MSVAAADVVDGGDLLGIAVRYGYGSTEAFGRAFRAVHGVGPGDVRRDGGPLRTQPQLRFRLTVEGNTPMDTRIAELPDLRLVGHAARVPLIHEGVNPHIQAHIASLPAEEHAPPEGAEQRRAAGPAAGERRRRPRLHRGQRADLPARRRRRRGHARARRPRRDRGAGRDMGGVPHLRPVPGRAAVHVGRHRRPTGSRPTRGACGPARRSWPSSSAPTTSAPRRRSCGCRWNAPSRSRTRRSYPGCGRCSAEHAGLEEASKVETGPLLRRMPT